MAERTENDKNSDVQIGKPPDIEDKFWLDVASKMTPEESLKRLDTHGKYIFSTVSIVGTLLTGFGIFSSQGATVLRNPLFLIPVSLACLSLALSMMGITPNPERVNRNDIYSVRNYYNDLILKRGKLIFAASILFALSLLSVAIVLTVPAKPSPLAPAISVRLIGSGDKNTLSAKVEMQEMPRLGMAETEIVGYEDEKGSAMQTVLFKDATYADLSGKMTVSAELDQIQRYKWFVITSRVKIDTKLIIEKKVEVRR